MKIISENHPDAVKTASKLLKAGEVISFATDTVYGVACDASNPSAVDNLFAVKKRRPEKPVAIFLHNVSQARELFIFDDLSNKIADKLLPGPITLILEKNPSSITKLADNLNPGNNSLGFRIVKDQFIENVLQEFSGILAVSSANIADHAPAQNSKEVENYFSHSKLSLIIDKNMPKSGKVSTVIKITENKIDILRQGAVSENAINLALTS